MTHDLIKNILESVDARVAKVEVNDLRENTFYAVIHLQLGAPGPRGGLAPVRRHRARPPGGRADLRRRGGRRQGGVRRGRAKETGAAPARSTTRRKIKEWLESLKPGDFDKIERGKDPGRAPDE